MAKTPSNRISSTAYGLLAAALAALPGAAMAHGFAGKRFFPTPLTFDDTFTQDDVGVSYRNIDNVDRGGVFTHQQGVEGSITKSVTPTIAVTLGTAYNKFKFSGATALDGRDNLAVGVRAIGDIDPVAESVYSMGLDVSVSGTGDNVSNNDYSIFSPTFTFAKGLGNLSAQVLRPIQISGSLAFNLPTRGNVSRTASAAFAFEYNLSYMTSFVRDTGLPGALRGIMLVVETPLSMCLDQGCEYDLTGTVNPGVMLYNTYGQVALEAPIPINGRTGNSIGVMAQLRLYLDDIFPNSIGRPIFD